MRARLGVLWAKAGLWLFGSPLHSPALLHTDDTVPTEAPFQIVGTLAGRKVNRAELAGAKARQVWESMVREGRIGRLEFRHDGAVRSRYERGL